MSRVAIAAIALLLGLASLPVIGAASQIRDEPTCRDVGRGNVELPRGEDCFPGSTTRQAAVVGLLFGSGAMALAAMLLGAAAAALDRREILVVLVAVVAALLFAGAYVAARV